MIQQQTGREDGEDGEYQRVWTFKQPRVQVKKRKGKSYAKRVADIEQIYDTYVKTGLSNREIWKRYVYPQYGISERTFYNLLKASINPEVEGRSELSAEGFLFPELLFPEDEVRDPGYFKKNP